MILRWSALAVGACVACVCLSGIFGKANGEDRLQTKSATEGRRLFALNCAHCHGDDSRGDEGPSLYDLRKSDARISKIIREGIKGEMPGFGKKLNEKDVNSLIAFLRTLKE